MVECWARVHGKPVYVAHTAWQHGGISKLPQEQWIAVQAASKAYGLVEVCAPSECALFYLCQRARRIRLQGVLPHALILALARRHIDWLQLCRQMLRPQIV